MNPINRDHLTDLIVEMSNTIADHELQNENVEFLARHQIVHGCKGLVEIPIVDLIKKYKECMVFESNLDDMEWNIICVAWIDGSKMLKMISKARYIIPMMRITNSPKNVLRSLKK